VKTIMIGLILILLVGCGAQATPTLVPTVTPRPTPTPTPTPEPPDPAEVTQMVVDAMQTLDIEAASEHFCEEQRSDLDSSLEEGFAELEAMGLDPDELLDAFQLNFDDVEYEERSQEGDEAVVHVSGSMSLEFDTDKLREFFRKASEASGQEVTDQELDFVVGIFESMSGQEAPLDADVKLIKEDGEWVVCDDLSFLEAGDIFELPLP
jgi:hypothetical protein